MSDLTVLVDAVGESEEGLIGLEAGRVEVVWEPGEVKVEGAAREHLEARWGAYLADALAQGRTLFNAPVTRLIAAQSMQRDGKQRIQLRLGPADYKTFVVTRLRDRVWFEAHAPEAMALALGNSALLTRGEEAFLGIRSARVSAYAGRAHLVGGVLDLLGTEQFSADADGMVAHLRLEMREAGLEGADLEGTGRWPRMLAVVQDEYLGQPEAIWQWEVIPPLEEIGQRLDVSEHGGWVRVCRGKMDDETWDLMTPVARHTWKIWSGAS